MRAWFRKQPLLICLLLSLLVHAVVVGAGRLRSAGESGRPVRAIVLDYFRPEFEAEREPVLSSPLPPEEILVPAESESPAPTPPSVLSPPPPDPALPFPTPGEEMVVGKEAGPAAPGPTPSREEAISAYILELKNRIEGEIRYPDQAVRMGLEGSVVISFTLHRDGRLERFLIPSGGESEFAPFNREALRAVWSASRRFSAFPEVLPDETITFRLPVSFVLK